MFARCRLSLMFRALCCMRPGSTCQTHSAFGPNSWTRTRGGTPVSTEKSPARTLRRSQIRFARGRTPVGDASGSRRCASTSACSFLRYRATAARETHISDGRRTEPRGRTRSSPWPHGNDRVQRCNAHFKHQLLRVR